MSDNGVAQLESPFFNAELFEAGSRPATATFIVVEDERQKLLTDGDYAFHQGTVFETGSFAPALPGRAALGKIDPQRPFVFEVRDRVCAIRSGAFLDPDDARIQYGGTWFNWEFVRENA